MSHRKGLVLRMEMTGGREMRRYVTALAAAGLMGWCGGGHWAFGQEGGQAVNPVDVRGGGQSAPAAAVPGAAATPAGAGNGAAAAPSTGVPAQAPVAAGASDQVAPAPAGAAAVPADAGGQAVVPATVTPSTGVPPAPTNPPLPTAPASDTTATPAAPAAPGVVPATGGLTVSTATTNAATGPATRMAEGVYPLTGVKVNYLKEQPQQPPIEQLMSTVVELGVKGDAFVAPRDGTQRVKLRLGDVGKGEIAKIQRSGIESLYTQIVHFYNARGIIGVYVVVDAKDIDGNDRDIRPADRTTLQFIVVTSAVKQVRTVLTGDRVKDDNRVDDTRHQFIKDRSPLKATPGSDMLNKDELDEYVMRLNRQPGRRVDVAVSGAGEIGGVTLDYLVSESRPWYAYAQISNTGTKQTNEWRERFGVVDNQLTGHDDVFSLDYVTAGFTASHSVIAAYELPFFSVERLRYKVYGSYNEFQASDVGQNNEQFSGDQWVVGNELIYNVFQHRELFVDLVGGVRGQGVSTNNVTAQLEGQATFIAPYAGVRVERATDLAVTAGQVLVMSYLSGEDQRDIEKLGRAEPSDSPVVLQWDFAQTLYLEPLIDPNGFAAGNSTLAHELYFGTRGQYSPDRLFPQAQEVAGGLYSVRGYPESISAGDTVVIGSVEYRFHFPRILPVNADPKRPFLWEKRFKYAPSQVYGRPDWDLIARAFFDAAQVWNSDKLPFEEDRTLAGTGVGLELQYKQNLNIRVDWGFALIGIRDEVSAGENRVHVSATLLY